MAYQPNFHDPRTRRRCEQASAWAQAHLSVTRPRSWARVAIDAVFGTQNHNLSRWLRQQLLLVHSHQWSRDTGKCKTYLLNSQGLDLVIRELGAAALRPLTQAVQDQEVLHHLVNIFTDNNTQDSSLNISPPTNCTNAIVAQVPEKPPKTTTFSPTCATISTVNLSVYNVAQVAKIISQKHQQELQTLQFNYRDQSHRLWHPLQNANKEVKSEIFSQAGLPWNWDIQCCAPTLILQQARMIGRLQTPTPVLDQLIADRNWFRNELAADVGILPDQAKQVINALLCGARLGFNSEHSSIARYLNSDQDSIFLLRSSSMVQQLRDEIRQCWASLAHTVTRREITTAKGHKKLLPVSPRQKWDIYFTQERRVLQAVCSFLDLCKIRYFLEHDGWRTDQEFYEPELEQWVYKKTGFVVRVQGDPEMLQSAEQHRKIAQ